MGREIRRVPPGWEHPRQKCEHSPWMGGCDEARESGGYCFKPLHNKTWEEAMRVYEAEKAKWEAGDFPSYTSEESRKLSYEAYDGPPPDPEYYRPAYTSEPTHYQVYETVSEGTPVTPVFATEEELITYLAEKGTFWDQIPSTFSGKPARGGWGRENAEAFVRSKWMPSMVMQGGKILEPKDYLKKELSKEDLDALSDSVIDSLPEQYGGE